MWIVLLFVVVVAVLVAAPFVGIAYWLSHQDNAPASQLEAQKRRDEEERREAGTDD